MNLNEYLERYIESILNEAPVKEKNTFRYTVCGNDEDKINYVLSRITSIELKDANGNDCGKISSTVKEDREGNQYCVFTTDDRNTILNLPIKDKAAEKSIVNYINDNNQDDHASLRNLTRKPYEKLFAPSKNCVVLFNDWLKQQGQDPEAYIKNHNVSIIKPSRDYSKNSNVLNLPMTASVTLSIDNQKVAPPTLKKNGLDNNGCPIKKCLNMTDNFYNWCIQRNLDSVINSYNNAEWEEDGKLCKNPPIDEVSNLAADLSKVYNFKCAGCEEIIPRSIQWIKIQWDKFLKITKQSKNADLYKNLGFNVFCEKCQNKQNNLHYSLHNGSLASYEDDPLVGRIVEEWDDNKNKYIKNEETGINLSVDTVSCSYDKKVWWRCQVCQTEYQASVIARMAPTRYKKRLVVSCPQCKVMYNSLAEATVYYYIKKLFPQTISNYRGLKNKGITELDVFIPKGTPGLPEEYKEGFAIEYNGFKWHEKKQEQDKIKIENCEKNGITLVTIADTEDTIDVDMNSSKTNLYRYTYAENSDDLYEIINDIIKNYLHRNIGINKTSDIKEIYKYRENLVKQNSFGGCQEFKSLDWDYDENVITPLGISTSSNAKVQWVCHVCGALYSATVVTKTMSYYCPCIPINSRTKNAKTYKLYHDTWDSNKDKELLAAQDKFFNSDDDMKRDDFIKLINDTRNNHIIETNRKFNISHPTLNVSDSKVKNAYKD